MSNFVRQHATNIDYRLGETWTILNEIEQSIKQKVEGVGIPLKDWNLKISRGILTGLNEAFIISKEKRDELITKDPRSAEIIRPILRGRDINQLEVNFQDLYLINTHNGYESMNGKKIPPVNINNYPAIKDWLDSGDWNTKPQKGTNFERLSRRTDQGVTPYNLRSLSYMDDFNKQKIVYPNMTKFLPFYLDYSQKYLTNQKAFIITGNNLGYLTAFCNSLLFKFVYSDNFPELQGGTRELSKVFFEKILVKEVSITKENEYFHLIKQIQKNRSCGAGTKLLEKQLNQLIFEEYSLSKAEVNYILKQLN